jgi:hypothetical protein
MKQLTAEQIAQVKQITTWTSTRFHGNTKKVGHLLISDLKAIVSKKYNRSIGNYVTKNGRIIYPINFKSVQKSNVQKVKELIKWSLEAKGTSYFKLLIEGNTGIYYASPVYGHSDYNKTRLFNKTPETLRLMYLFNKIVNK